MSTQPEDKKRDQATPQGEYEAPRVLEDQPLEHMSLTCGKIDRDICLPGTGGRRT